MILEKKEHNTSHIVFCVTGRGDFLFTDRQELFGNIAIKNPGTYTVTVIFDQPNKYYPTIATQEFRVVEN